MPVEGLLSPKAACRVAREGVAQTFPKATEALNEDWGTQWDAKQIQRWVESMGQTLLAQQRQEVARYERGERPRGPKNDPELLVIELDGGRVQEREKDVQTLSRWREDKVLTITNYQPGDGKEREPVALVTTYMATMQASDELGSWARVEAERRGIRQAKQTLVLGDGAAWIDAVHQEQFPRQVRIVDWYHAAQHLHEVAKAIYPQQESRCQKLAESLKTLLWQGRSKGVVKVLERWSSKLGQPQNSDEVDHPRRVVARNAGYFKKHSEHMNYPQYRRRGWPIGSGVVESGVKQFNKRVKGTEQFWTQAGVESVLALRAMWLSSDQRWDHYWLCGRQLRAAA
jgi:hypothetical protein